MSTSPVFEWLSAEIGMRTGFDVLKSRGTLRLALHGVGLEPRTLTKEQAELVVERVLPGELKLRGFADAEQRCLHIGAALKLAHFTQVVPESAESAFARLGRKL